MALLVAIFLVALPSGDTDPRVLHAMMETDPLRTSAGMAAGLVAFTLLLWLFMLFPAAIGQGSDLAMIATTLAVAIAIQPVRRRLQTVIDRRFARRKYDAARTLATYAETLREQTDTRTVEAGLLRVAEDTMQPAHVSLWLRSTPHGAPRA